MKRLTPLLFVLIVASCNSPMDRTIFEELSFEELKSEIERDSTFEDVYRYVKEIRDSILVEDIDRVKWSEITYQNVYSYVKRVNDTSFFRPLFTEELEKWNENQVDYSEKLDSVLSFWEDYKSKHSPDGYAKVELVKIDKEYYSNGRDIRKIKLGLRLTPLKGKIEQMSFRYRVKPKIDEGEDDKYSIANILDYRACLMSRPFSTPVVRYWEVDYSDRDYFKNSTLSEFKRDYFLDIEVYEVRVGGRNLRERDLDIPNPIEFYWDELENEQSFMREYYKTRIIREYIDPNYQQFSDHYSELVDSIIQSFDPLVYDFLKLAEDY